MRPLNKVSICGCIFLALISSKSNCQDQPTAPHLLVTVLVDTSGSMASDSRLDIAKREIIAKARDLVPSPTSPWIIVPFDSEVRGPRRFVNGVDELEAYVNGLSADGGTNISSALTFAHEGYSRAQHVPHLLCFFYSDGEDPRPEDVNAATDRLDKLFAQRVDQGLSQSLVVRRWSSANSDLVTRLKDGGNVDVIDAGEAQLQHVTLEPQLTVVDRSWSVAPILRVLIDAEIIVKGQNSAGGHSPLDVSCTTPNVQFASTTINPGSGPVHLELFIEIDPNNVPDSIDLAFEISTPPPAATTSTGVLISTLSRDRVNLTLDVPPLLRKSTVTATAVAAEPVRWIDPLEWKFELLIDLSVTVTTELSAVPYRQPVEFTVTGNSDLTLLGNTTFSVDRPGTFALQIPAQSLLKAPATTHLTILSTDSLPADQSFDPIPLGLSLEVSPPEPIITHVTAAIESVAGSQWISLRTGSVLQRAKLSLKADHPLRTNSTVRLVASGGVVLRQLSSRLTDPIEFAIMIQPKNGILPHQIPLEVSVEPSQQGAINIEGPITSTLTLTEPPPAQLALAMEGNVTRRIDVPIQDWAAGPTLQVTPVVLGVVDKRVAEGILADVRIAGPLKQTHERPVTLFSPSSIQLSLEGHRSPQPFFRDTVVESVLHATASPQSARIKDTEIVVLIRREAVAKRYFMTALGILFVALVVILPFRFVSQLNNHLTDEP